MRPTRAVHRLVHNYIEMATQRGMYAIVDWHKLTPGDPNHNLARARTFFTEIAQPARRTRPNVIYEVANEPNGVSWSRIKSYHEQIIPVIRAQDPDASILLGTRAWSSLGVSDGADETEVINNPVNATNIMYTFHFYAASHDDEYLDALSRAADRIPMFVTEFGTQTSSGDGGNDFAHVAAVHRPHGEQEDQLDELELLRRPPLRRGLHRWHLPERSVRGHRAGSSPPVSWIRERILVGR